ncbi:MAG: VWA domain-containing protein [Polyangiales bacterium]
MELSYGLTRPVLPAGETVTVDLLLTFHTDYAAARRPDRRPLSVSIVIDRSGSMSGRPLKQATEAAGLLVRQLSPSDTVSVVVYDSRVDTIVAPTRVTDPEAIVKKVNGVRPAGATALHGGWLRGCEHAAEVPSDEAVRRVLLLTDGQANVGVTATPEIVAQAAKQAEQAVVTSTLGFGLGFNEDLLIGMAEAGRGNFYYIESPDEATQLFLIEGESITAIGAQDLTVTLRPRRGVTIEEAIDARALKTGKDGSLRVPVGDVYGGEDRHVALTVTVQVPEAGGDFELFDVAYTYDPVATASRRGEVSETAVVRATAGRADARPDPNVMRTVSRLRVALAKERAVTRSDAGEHDVAAELLRHEAAQQRTRGMDEEYEIAEEVSQLEHFADLMANKRFDYGARKALRDQSYQGRSRSRADLTARGAGGGSAKSLDEASEVGSGVLLTCEREAGKLRVKAHGERVDGAVPVLIPRAVREEGVAYVADALEPSAHGTFYRVKGALRRLAKAPRRRASRRACSSTRSSRAAASRGCRC